MSKYSKFWIAIVSPVATAVWPFLSDGWQPSDLGPVIVGVLVALGVYSIPNAEARIGRQAR
jgi:hypothetical protein